MLYSESNASAERTHATILVADTENPLRLLQPVHADDAYDDDVRDAFDALAAAAAAAAAANVALIRSKSL
jgi:hypothetical protein